MNIQDEAQKIHHQYGTTEMANYQIEKLFDKKMKEDNHTFLEKIKKGFDDIFKSEEPQLKAFEIYYNIYGKYHHLDRSNQAE